MALDFPSSPTNGQVYSGYTYDSTKGVWAIDSSTITNMTVSDTAPSNPLSGDSWFDSTTGYVFVYYTDADSSQWVQTTGAYTDTALVNRVTNVESKAALTPNYIINGAFDFWQRGTSFSTGAASPYCADRWVIGRSATTGADLTRQAAGLAGFQYAARVQRTASNAATPTIYLTTSLETNESLRLSGQTVTVSFYARAGANYSAASSLLVANLVSGTGTDQNLMATVLTGQATVGSVSATLTTSWQRFSFTGAVSSSATQLAMSFAHTPVGTAGAADYYEITGVQLEAGTVATAFRRAGNTLQAELAACQRYYEKSYDVGVAPGTASNVGMVYGSQNVGAVTTGYIGGQIVYKVTKRIPPTTVTLYDALGAAGKCQRFILGTTTNQGQTIYADTGSGNTNVTLVYSSGTASAAGLGFQFTSDAEIN